MRTRKLHAALVRMNVFSTMHTHTRVLGQQAYVPCTVLSRKRGWSRASCPSASHTPIDRFDTDGDGKLTEGESRHMLQHTGAEQHIPTTPAPARVQVQGWDAGLQAGLHEAHTQGLPHLLSTLLQAKLVRPITSSVTASDVVWSSLGMFISVYCLGCLNTHVKELPGVGAWHRRGLNLLLGSFGTICVLLFARPEAEAIRVWNLIVGHLVSVVAVVAVIAALGPGVLSRALAMSLALAAMMLTDSVHPPGGALILLAEDSAAIQSMAGWFFLYPSLTWTIAILLPIGAVVNWLKRNRRFDWPWQHASAPVTGNRDNSAQRMSPGPTAGTDPLDSGDGGWRPKLA